MDKTDSEDEDDEDNGNENLFNHPQYNLFARNHMPREEYPPGISPGIPPQMGPHYPYFDPEMSPFMGNFGKSPNSFMGGPIPMGYPYSPMIPPGSFPPRPMPSGPNN